MKTRVSIGLLAVILIFAICSCTNENPASSENPAGIPNAPSPNTNRQDISDYESIYANIIEGSSPVSGPSGIGFDVVAAAVQSFYTLEAYLADNNIAHQNDVEYDIGTGLTGKIISWGKDSEEASFVFSWSQHSLYTQFGTITLWGEASYSCSDSIYSIDVSAIIDINGMRFSFVSNDMNYNTKTEQNGKIIKIILKGTAEINGEEHIIYCYLYEA